MSNSSSPGPMYGAPQTPTPVPVPQAIAEEAVVTSAAAASCYAPEQQQQPPAASRGYEQQQQQGPGQYQQQHYTSPQQPAPGPAPHHQQQQQGGHYQQPSPLYHHQPGPQYQPHPAPEPVAVVQFTSQHPQPQPQQQQHYQVHLQPHPHHHAGPAHHQQHYQQQQHHRQGAAPQPHYSQPAPAPVSQGGMAPPPQPHPAPSPVSQPQPQQQPQPVMMNPRPPQQQQQQQQQYYSMAPQQQQQAGPGQVRLQPQIRQWPTVRQPVQSGQQVVVKTGPGVQMVGGQQQKVPQVVQQGIAQPGQRPLVIQHRPPAPGQPQHHQNYIIRGPGQLRPGLQPGPGQQIRYRVLPQQGQQVPITAVQLRPGGVQQPVRHIVQVRPGVAVPGQQPRQVVRMGSVIQQTDQQQQQQHSYPPQQQQQLRYGAPQPVQWRQAVPGPQHAQQFRVVAAQQAGQGQVPAQKPVQRQFVSQPGQQQPPGPQQQNIQYNIEHVFNENGKEVRKMPVEINGETVWVDVVDQSNLDPDILDVPLDDHSGGQLGGPKPGTPNTQ